MIAIFFSLIVSGTWAAPLNFLGVDSVILDPSSHLRTALNVLDTPVHGYGLFQSAGLFHGYHPQVGFYPPVSAVSAVRVPAPALPVHHHFAASPFGFTYPHHFVPQFAPVDLEVKAEVVDDIVDVAEEVEDDSFAGPIITIAESNDVIPIPHIPVLTGREPSLAAPPIPSGIVQATQPKFVQVVFQNHKASPHLPNFVFNSKTSPLLTAIREEAAGILTL
jgi:hypothetical protein